MYDWSVTYQYVEQEPAVMSIFNETFINTVLEKAKLSLDSGGEYVILEISKDNVTLPFKLVNIKDVVDAGPYTYEKLISEVAKKFELTDEKSAELINEGERRRYWSKDENDEYQTVSREFTDTLAGLDRRRLFACAKRILGDSALTHRLFTEALMDQARISYKEACVVLKEGDLRGFWSARVSVKNGKEFTNYFIEF